MNGGYIILENSIIDEVVSNITKGTKQFSVPGIYSLFKDAYGTNKIIFISSKTSVATFNSAISLFYIEEINRFTISVFAATTVASISFSFDDICYFTSL